MLIETNKEKLTRIFEGDDQMEETIDELDATKFFEADIAFYESYDHEAFQREVDKESREEEIAEAKEEAAKEIIKKMVESNLSVEDISKYTGLSIDEIKKEL